MYSVAVVGLGYFSQFHLASWVAMPGATVIGATDLSEDRRAWASSTYKVPVFDTLNSILAKKPDIVDIVAPPSAHAGLVRAAMARGRTIVCQKPFCASLEEATTVANEAKAAGARILIHENFRFQPWYRTIKNKLTDGSFGHVYSATFLLRPGDGRGPDAYLDRQPSFQTMERLMVAETGIHFIDTFRWLLGEVTSIYADLRQLNPVLKGEDAGIVVMEHASGAQSTIDANRLSDHPTDDLRRTMGEMTIEGEGGTLTVNGMGRVWFRPFGQQKGEVLPLAFPAGASFGGGCVAALNRHVIEALDGKRPFENSVFDYLPNMALSDLAYASDAAGQKIQVPA